MDMTKERFEKVDLPRGWETGRYVDGKLHTRLGGGDAIAVPVLKYSPTESNGSSEDPTLSSCEITDATARLLAEELAERMAVTPKFPEKGWHPIFLPTHGVKVNGKWYADPKALVEDFS